MGFLLRTTILGLFSGVLCSAGAVANENEESTVILAVASPESFQNGLPELRYPERDMRRFTDVMQLMSGVNPNHIIAVRDGKLSSVRDAFDRVRQILRPLDGRAKPSKFIFYFSGHSDSLGLHLSDGMLKKEEFHSLLAGVPAAAKIALLDSCYSGALTAKGVRVASEFSIPKAQFDEPSGAVFLAATSASEQAFEIDEIEGSLFTHYLTGGLYGQADANDDGLITVDEVYQYVYRQVNLNSLALPEAMQQKPEYTSRLSGRGALVMAYVEKKTGDVELPSDLQGEFTFSAQHGVRLFKQYKAAGQTKSIKLIPGLYDVVLRSGDQIGQTQVEVTQGKRTFLLQSAMVFKESRNMKTIAKGKRYDYFWGIHAGSHVGSMWALAPHVEASWASTGVRLPIGVWRIGTAVGGHVSAVEYERKNQDTQTGQSTTLSLVSGGNGEISLFDIWNGLVANVFVGIGADSTRIKWQQKAANNREFDPTMPKAALGTGASYLTPAGSIVDVAFRREWLFGTEKNTGDVLSFSSSLFLVGWRF